MSAAGDGAGGSRASVWETLAAMKARHSQAETEAETQRESLRLRSEAVSAVARKLNDAALTDNLSGEQAIAMALGSVSDGTRDQAVQAMIDDSAKGVSKSADEKHKELTDILGLHTKVAGELGRAKAILSKIADEREVADSRAGRLEYKVRG